MQEVLIFSGTSEGRELAEALARHNIGATVCVATEYGQEVMGQPKSGLLTVRAGRMDEKEMEKLIGGKEWRAVVDATHPFATEVTKNIAAACRSQGREALRLLREQGSQTFPGQKVVFVDTVKEAVDYLNQSAGNIFLATGSKSLPEYVGGIQDTSRIYARILPVGEEVERCRGLGLSGNQIICMQGPFSEGLNLAMMEAVQASILVTKETSKAGGFPEKLAAAKRIGAETIVLRRSQEQGHSLEEILQKIGVESGQGASDIKEYQITIAGMGMGSISNMTGEVLDACQDADIILGAKRMVSAVLHMDKPSKCLYIGSEIADFILTNPQYRKVTVLLSGDVGFYSGAKTILQAFEAAGITEKNHYQVRQLCGGSSPAYFASRLQVPWEGAALMSLHGRKQNIIGALEHCGKVFVLLDNAEGLRRLSRELLDYGFGGAAMHVGCQLSYPEEKIISGTPGQFLDFEEKGVLVALLVQENGAKPLATHGIADGSFIRGKAPMTKEEVRSISLSKLALQPGSIVYDIGAGTGSVSVECARAARDGKVYAIEKNPEALGLIEENKRRHRAWNIEAIAGEAPKALEGLEPPTHAFIGGSGGNLKEILGLLWQKSPKTRVVINAISLETIKEVAELLEEHEFQHQEIVQVSVAKAKKLGRHHLMAGQNPVYVVTLQK